MAPDSVMQDRVYQALKGDLFEGVVRPGIRLDLQRIADRHRVSATPVREAIYRLMGERIVEPYIHGGFQIVLLDATQLLHLYVWNLQHVLSALHILRAAQLQRALAGRQREMPSGVSSVDRANATAEFFAAIGQATGNTEFMAQIAAANDRLHYARVAESDYFKDAAHELRTLTKMTGSNVQASVRRRILAYHRRRFEHVAQISAVLADGLGR